MGAAPAAPAIARAVEPGLPDAAMPLDVAELPLAMATGQPPVAESAGLGGLPSAGGATESAATIARAVDSPPAASAPAGLPLATPAGPLERGANAPMARTASDTAPANSVSMAPAQPSPLAPVSRSQPPTSPAFQLRRRAATEALSGTFAARPDAPAAPAAITDSGGPATVPVTVPAVARTMASAPPTEPAALTLDTAAPSRSFAHRAVARAFAPEASSPALPFAEAAPPMPPLAAPSRQVARAMARVEAAPATGAAPLALATASAPAVQRSAVPSASGPVLAYPRLTPAEMPLAPATAAQPVQAQVQREMAAPEAVGRIIGDGDGTASGAVLATGFAWGSPDLPREIDKLADHLWQDLRRRLRIERERERGWV